MQPIDPWERDALPSKTTNAPGSAGLIPWSIVALGTPSQPVEHMMGMQSAVYRFIVLLGSLHPPSLRLGSRAPAPEPTASRGR